MSGQQTGYRRVGTVLQNTKGQLYGIESGNVFGGRCSGKEAGSPQRQAWLEYVRDGNTLPVVTA